MHVDAIRRYGLQASTCGVSNRIMHMCLITDRQLLLSSLLCRTHLRSHGHFPTNDCLVGFCHIVKNNKLFFSVWPFLSHGLTVIDRQKQNTKTRVKLVSSSPTPEDQRNRSNYCHRSSPYFAEEWTRSIHDPLFDLFECLLICIIFKKNTVRWQAATQTLASLSL